MTVTAPVSGNQSDNHQQQTAVVIHHNVPVEVNVQPIRVMYYCVTVEQLSEFSDIGCLVELFLALFGISAGAMISAWLALKQGGLTPEGVATLSTAMWASMIGSIVFLACAALLYFRQWKQKSRWIASYE
jgi:hypothetical protein